MPVDPTLGHRG